MAAIVLVPGAWMGGWAWNEVADQLTSRGHDPIPVTFSSMHVSASLADHVTDVVRAIESGGGGRSPQQDRLVLVGHSYGGLVAGLAADRAGRRPDRLVFVDSPVPRPGESMIDALPEEVGCAIADDITTTGFWSTPPSEVFVEDGVHPDKAQAVADHCAPHPGQTLLTPADTSAPPRPATYIRCVSSRGDHLAFAGVDEMKESPSLDFRTIESGHWPMLAVPGALAALLADVAES